MARYQQREGIRGRRSDSQRLREMPTQREEERDREISADGEIEAEKQRWRLRKGEKNKTE